jgi:D-sedoheptulose 7-phosphate isomerase
MNFAQEYIRELKQALDKLPCAQIKGVKDTLLNAYRQDRKIFIIGNGGSAATASHFACDLSKGTTIGNPHMKKRFKVIALTDNIPLLTAWGNDLDFTQIFVEQLKNLLDENDVVIAISGSGNSENILRAVEYANKKGALTIGLSGFAGGKLKDIAHKYLIVSSDSMERIEDIHLILEHLICSWLREELKSTNFKPTNGCYSP